MYYIQYDSFVCWNHNVICNFYNFNCNSNTVCFEYTEAEGK